MRFAAIERTCQRIIQLRNARCQPANEPLQWCEFVDALMDHLDWPLDRWEPNPTDPRGLNGRLRAEFDEMRGYLVLYTDKAKTQKTVVEFNLGVKGDVYHFTIGDARFGLLLDSSDSESNEEFLQKASKAIVDAVFDTARHVSLS